jgi:hypothetical protein
MTPDEVRSLSDARLREHLRDLRLEIGLLAPFIEAREERTQRTIKVIRGTVLMAGGLVFATFEPAGAILALLGGWDWIVGISDDAKAMNQNLAMRRKINDLNAELDVIESEFRRRGP